jgi:ribonuclease HI
MKNPPGWKRMMFKSNKVWLHVDDDQRPVVEDNKVLIKYQLDQDHEYWVRQEAVQPIDPARLRKKVSEYKPHNRPLSTDSKGRHDPSPEKTIVVYTDGASSGNPGPAGIGVVMRYGSHEKEMSKHIGITTNNVAELTAIKAALEAIHSTQIPVRLYTDSQYCYGLLSLGWKPKQNEKLVSGIKKLASLFTDLRIFKIEGHAGIDDNERADRLAREAVTGQATRKGRKA